MAPDLDRPASGAGALAAIGRPASNGRLGTAKPGTAVPGTAGTARTPGSGLITARTPGGSPLDHLSKKLIIKMRQRFGDAAADVKGQEIITQEVLGFMARAGTAKEEDIGQLTNRIRDRLTGSAPLANTMVSEKKAQVLGDEWAQIFEFQIAQGKAKDMAEAEHNHRQQLALRATLKGQQREVEDKRRQEHEEEMAYFSQEQAALKEWERQEEARRKLQADIMRKLKEEREEQLKDKNSRRQAALDKVRREDEDTAARIAYETRTEFEKEMGTLYENKMALRTFLAKNEENKALREEAKQKQWAEDKAFQQAWEAQLNKQEAARKAHVERLKLRQSLTAEMAKTRPEAKRWLDDAIIDKAYREREEARAREDDERQRRVKEGGQAMARRLEEQMKEREGLKQEDRKREWDAYLQVKERMAREEAKEAERRRKAEEAKVAFRSALDAQMKVNADRKRYQPMSETERLINSQLLDKVDMFKTTGRLPASGRATPSATGRPKTGALGA